MPDKARATNRCASYDITYWALTLLPTLKTHSVERVCRVKTHWPAGPKGCCCPSSPKISLKSSSSLPGQFAVVIGFDSWGSHPLHHSTVDDRWEQFAPSENVTTFTDCHGAKTLDFCSFNSAFCNTRALVLNSKSKKKQKQKQTNNSSQSSSLSFSPSVCLFLRQLTSEILAWTFRESRLPPLPHRVCFLLSSTQSSTINPRFPLV